MYMRALCSMCVQRSVPCVTDHSAEMASYVQGRYVKIRVLDASPQTAFQ